MAANERYDAVIVGAGFAGLYMLHKLRQAGRTAIVLEAGSGVGGTWFWNRYPGCRCDVESMQYSYSFSDELQQEWRWSERFAGQPEILSYAEHVAGRFGLTASIRLDTRVTAARYDEAGRDWTVETEQGDVIQARFCIMATGCLSAARTPELPGLASLADPRTTPGTGQRREWTSPVSGSALSAPDHREYRPSRNWRGRPGT